MTGTRTEERTDERTDDIADAEIIELNFAEEQLAGLVSGLQTRGLVTEDDAAEFSNRVQTLTDELRGRLVGSSIR
ncbi:hypothetical protein ACFQPA_21555 [Halomarina halobia]|uniref:Uncharacterized protein n=1 Tax=Halomarina halobia TaxID=3033386 RepID=A0ABD6AGZ2_9EURY|nr:hypothetical protein [Halomarina sp. PSR21]